ncbi:PTS sugar transporter subunit IIA [Pseudorhizobium marinum]|uniref:PTS sugar transporter subunit IIA n=1 Tax=Pseudorhizobium marinum TaxID=1496690 RepID=UPI00068DB419|nr:PTS sugar transporter subunit IIA [Pseudorhizobium marinum]
MRLSELLGVDGFLLGLPFGDKRSALKAITANLAVRRGQSEGAILNALLRRERLGSTATGDGVAVPHALLEGISEPAAVLATLQHSISFDAPDGRNVDLLLGLLWPCDSREGFFFALAQSIRLLHQSSCRECLYNATSSAEAHAGIEALEKMSGGSLHYVPSMGRKA